MAQNKRIPHPNKKTNVFIETPSGQLMYISQAARAYGLDVKLLHQRVAKQPICKWFLPVRKTMERVK